MVLQPEVIPLFPLAGALLLPQAYLPLNIFEPRYVRMVDDSLRTHRMIGMIQPKSEAESIKSHPSLADIGCLGRIVQFAETGDGRYLITLLGVSRFRLNEELLSTAPYRQGGVDYSRFPDDAATACDETGVDRAKLLSAFQDFARDKEMNIDWKNLDKAPTASVVNAFAMVGPFSLSEKQALLEAASQKSRASMLITLAEFSKADSRQSGARLQ